MAWVDFLCGLYASLVFGVVLGLCLMWLVDPDDDEDPDLWNRKDEPEHGDE